MNRFAFIMAGIFIIFLASSAVFYTFQKCGMKTLILGNGALTAAATGMCDK